VDLFFDEKYMLIHLAMPFINTEPLSQPLQITEGQDRPPR
jgi:hypothetical protein